MDTPFSFTRSPHGHSPCSQTLPSEPFDVEEKPASTFCGKRSWWYPCLRKGGGGGGPPVQSGDCPLRPSMSIHLLCGREGAGSARSRGGKGGPMLLRI